MAETYDACLEELEEAKISTLTIPNLAAFNDGTLPCFHSCCINSLGSAAPPPQRYIRYP